MKLIFATQNPHKIEEAADILGCGFEIVSPADLGLTEDVEETGSTFEENSLIKAAFIREKLGGDCFADDSGLEVDILDGAPGIYSARYGGKAHDHEANIEKLLHEISLRIGRKPAKAQFRTVVTLLLGEEKHIFEGVLHGHITFDRAGDGGFGYDPVFVPDEIPSDDGTLVPNTEGLTDAQLPPGGKNAISHRGIALRAMASFLNERKGA